MPCAASGEAYSRELGLGRKDTLSLCNWESCWQVYCYMQAGLTGIPPGSGDIRVLADQKTNLASLSGGALTEY